MRPIKLEMKGFSAFKNHTEVDFTGADLVAFIGPTGSGKSSIIDAIGFALYGSISRYKNASLVAPVVNQLSTEARVRFDFESGGKRYSAVRVVRKSGSKASTKEARLECGDEVLAGNSTELDAAVAELLGLDFDQFTKTVVLPQGDFSRFLTERSGDRQALLRRLLGMQIYSKVGQAARERAKESSSKAAVLVQERSRFESTGQDKLDVLDEQIAALRAASTVADSAAQRRNALYEAVEACNLEVQTHTGVASLIAEANIPAGIEGLALRVDSATSEVAAANDHLRSLELDRSNLESELGAIGAAADLQRGLASLDELDTLTANEASIHELLEVKRSELATAAEAVDTATAKNNETIGFLDRAKGNAGAAGLVHLLSAGEPCPLCLQSVADIPDHPPSEVDDALSAQKAAASALSVAQQSFNDLTNEVARFEARASSNRESLERLRSHVDQSASRDDFETALGEAERLEGQITSIVQEINALRATSRKLEVDLGSLTTEQTAAQTLFGRVRDRLAPLGPPASTYDLAADVETLRQWIDAQRVVTSMQVASAEQSASLAQMALESHDSATFASITATLPFDIQATNAVEAAKWINDSLAKASTEVELVKQRIAEGARLAEKIGELERTAAIATDLGQKLRSGGFEQWLMADAMHSLAERASVRLLTLSGGAYSLITDGTEFEIRDHANADEVRSAKTLSGGETFLASLSLALALGEGISEMASANSPSIESIFLDEGFGTLDSETLDIVTSAIEELGASGRFVGVVTHIDELADRVPTRFEVKKRDGSSYVERLER